LRVLALCFPAVFFLEINDFALLNTRDKKVGVLGGFIGSRVITDSGDLNTTAALNPVFVRGMDIRDSSEIS
jgi:hypothetical protein